MLTWDQALILMRHKGLCFLPQTVKYQSVECDALHPRGTKQSGVRLSSLSSRRSSGGPRSLVRLGHTVCLQVLSLQSLAQSCSRPLQPAISSARVVTKFTRLPSSAQGCRSLPRRLIQCLNVVPASAKHPHHLQGPGASPRSVPQSTRKGVPW